MMSSFGAKFMSSLHSLCDAIYEKIIRSPGNPKGTPLYRIRKTLMRVMAGDNFSVVELGDPLDAPIDVGPDTFLIASEDGGVAKIDVEDISDQATFNGEFVEFDADPSSSA